MDRATREWLEPHAGRRLRTIMREDEPELHALICDKVAKRESTVDEHEALLKMLDGSTQTLGELLGLY